VTAPEPRPRSFLSFGLATLTAALLALAGWLVAEASEDGPDPVELAGVEVLVPEGWIKANPSPGLLAVRTHPADPLARIEIAEPASGDPGSAADGFLEQAGWRLSSFYVEERTDREDSVWIDYRFVTTDPRGGPVVVAGRIGFVETAAGLRSLGVEAREAEFADIGEVFPDTEGSTGR